MANDLAINQVPDVDPEATRYLGRTLGGKYRLEGVLGSGGMAHVFRAANTVIGRTVAIKILRPEHATNAETVERFLREAQTANLVRHPNVIDVIDFGTDSDGTCFIVQELLEGETLFAYAARWNGILPVSELRDLLGPVLSAVGEAHALGIVHRDLKPENVFLSGQRGRRVPKVLDFGISKLPGKDMTAAGMMLGTPAYMAPELAKSSKLADPRTDVWAIGAMLFELLTGRLPFEGDTVGAMFFAIMNVDAARLVDLRPDLPEALSNVIAKCMRRDPAERYSDARALETALMDALATIQPAPSGQAATMAAVQDSSLQSRLPSRTVAGSGISLRVAPPTPTRPMESEARVRTPEPLAESPKRQTQRSVRGTKSSQARRRSAATVRRTGARQIVWSDVLGILAVGVLLSAAILAAFHFAR